VLTQPDRPVGRGLQLAASAVKKFSLERGLEVFQPSSLRETVVHERVRAARAEALIVAAYGLLLPPEVLGGAAHGALNIHASLLPRWRGAAPIQRALLAGDAQTGISIMQMDAGLDTGAVLASRAIPITPQDDAGSLHDKLADLGAEMIVDTLDDIRDGRARGLAQGEEGVTYARKIDKRETLLDWTRPALELERCVRAFRPLPGAATSLDGAPLKIWQASVVEGVGNPGTVLSAGDALVIACAGGALAISELQRSGGKRLPVREFLRGCPLVPGTSLRARQ
jgi:methionyl-tRNA formyltransferase